MNNVWQVLKRPIITEKGVDQKDIKRTLTFEVHPDATKTQIRQAVQKIFNVKVASVQTAIFAGKERRRGKFSGYRSDWKKAYVKLKPGEKMVEFAEHR
jgi:large subunit ribosomal protein L23